MYSGKVQFVPRIFEAHISWQNLNNCQQKKRQTEITCHDLYAKVLIKDKFSIHPVYVNASLSFNISIF